MRVLLVYPPHSKEIVMGYPPDYTTKARSDLPPLGLLYLTSYLKKDHDVQVIDMSAMAMKPEDITSAIDNFKPGLIGISCTITYWMSILEVADAAKRHAPHIPIVLGGPNPTFYPAETLAHKEIDYVICGCGQIPLMELCSYLENGKGIKVIEHCYTRDSIGSWLNSQPDTHSLDDFPIPDRIAIPIELYNVPFCPANPTTSMMSSQGCCFKCAFCNCRNKKPVHVRLPAKVIDEMAEIEKLGIRSVMFQDDLFTIDAKRIKSLCEGIISRGINLRWTVKSRVDCLKEWMPPLMKKAGCFNIHFGIESGNDKTLARMKKGITIEQARKAVSLAKKAGLSCTGNFMLGYPGEGEEEIKNTINFAKELGLSLSQFSITMDMPGTELYKEAISSGKYHGKDLYREFTLDPEKNDITRLFSSERFGEEEMFSFLQEAYSKTNTLYNVHKRC